MVSKIKKIYKNNPDLITLKLKDYYIIYFESLCSLDKLNEYITKPIINSGNISSPNIKKITFEKHETYLNNGYAIIIKNKKIIAAEVKGNLQRSIESPSVEPALNGPKDSLTENIQTNLGLIKRRIKTKDLKIINKTVGTYSNTLLDILYLDKLADKDIINDIIKRIDNISEKEILDSGNLSIILQEDNKCDYPVIYLNIR